MSGQSIIARFGASVRKLRFRLGISQEVLAERAHLHRTYIADIERGARNVTLKSIDRLAQALEVSTADLLLQTCQTEAAGPLRPGLRPPGELADTLLVEDDPNDVEAEAGHAQAGLQKAHKELVETSRQAGIAQIATGVLHNVMNALTSINVASASMAQSLRNSNASALSKVVGLFRQHESDLGQFLASDPKGKQIPGYLAKLSERLIQEQESVLKELAQLQESVEHIKSIVTCQQNLAKKSGAVEVLEVSDLVEDALGLSGSPFFSGAVRVCKEIENDVFIRGERHKLLQILVNLVRNAKQSCDAVHGKEKKLTVCARNDDQCVSIAVSDTGVGIPAENLSRIFTHGFTTKKDGHGFGLHTSARLAEEMGGKLRAESEGPGKGATFTLEIPKPHH